MASENPSDGMALSREKRRNAGARMAELLNKEEEVDDFYKEKYGGFFDEEGDTSYESSIESGSDSADSDFDVEEAKPEEEDDADDDYEKEQEMPKKKAKAYKEPVFRPRPTVSKAETEEAKSTSVIPKRSSRPLSPPSEKQFRHSTLLKSVEYERRREATKIKRDHRKKYRRVSEYYRMPTQEELLKEAEETEEKNLKSLERFQEYELEKRKRSRFGRQRLIKGPYIREISMTMPAWNSELHQKSSGLSYGKTTIISHPPSGNGDKKFYVGDDQSNGTESRASSVAAEFRSEGIVGQDELGKCARTFVVFSDDATFHNHFAGQRTRPTVPKPQYCVVTGMPAKYIDPLTKLPYANADAFKIIRDSYYKYVEEKGDKNDPDVANWLQYRRTATT